MAKKKNPKNRDNSGKADSVVHKNPLWMKLDLKKVLLINTVLTVILFWDFIFSGKAIFGSDTFVGIYQLQFFREYLLKNFALPLWNPYILGGLPLMDALVGDSFFPTAILRLIMPLYKAIGWRFVIMLPFGGLFMYMFLKKLNLKEWPSLLGSVGYVFSSVIVTYVYAGHEARFFVCLLLPLVMWGFERFFAAPNLWNAILSGSFMGFSILTGHPQMAYFSLLPAGAYYVYKMVSLFLENRNTAELIKFSLYGVLMVVLALMLGAVVLYPSVEYVGNYSPRTGGVDYDYAASWSLHPEEGMMMIIPQFSGYLQEYWGRNPFKLNCEYAGLGAIVFGLIWALFRFRKSGMTRFFAITAALSFLFALGPNTVFHKFCYYFVPGINKMRGPSMSMFAFSFSCWVLAAFFLHHIYERKQIDMKLKKITFFVFAFLGGLGLLFLVTGNGFFSLWRSVFGYPDPQKMAIIERNADYFQGGIFVYLILLGGMFYFVFNAFKNKRLNYIALIGLFVLFFADSYRINSDFVKTAEKEQYFPNDDIVRFLQRDTSDFRVFPLSDRYQRNILPLFGIKSLTGFHDFELKWFRDFSGGRERKNFLNMDNHFQFLDLANVKYLIAPDPKVMKQFEVIEKMDKFNIVYRSRRTGLVVFENKEVLPRFRIAHEYRNFSSSDEVLTYLKEQRRPLHSEVYLENFNKKVDIEDSPVLDEWVKVIKDDMREMVLKVNMEKSGFLVDSDNYFPYWKIHVDGELTEDYRAYGTFRALYLEKGEHEVKITYVSTPLNLSLYLYGAGWLVFLTALGAIMLSKRKNS